MKSIYIKLFLIAIMLFIPLCSCASGRELNHRYERIFEKAQQAEKEERQSDALKYYLKILKRYPESVKVLERVVYLNMKEDRASVAREYAEKAVKLGAAPISCNILGMLFERDGKLPYAQKYYLLSIEADPNYPSPYNNLGNLALKNGEGAKAFSYYKKALELDGENPLFYNNLGLASELTGDRENARQNYLKALEYSPEDQNAKLNLARVNALLSPAPITQEQRDIADRICPYLSGSSYNLFSAFTSDDGVDTAIYSYRGMQRFILKLLPEDSKLNELVFAELMNSKKQDPERTLQLASEIPNLKIVGRGYINTVRGPIFYVTVTYTKDTLPFEGIFLVVSNKNRSIMVSVEALKGFYKRSVSEPFIKKIVRNL